MVFFVAINMTSYFLLLRISPFCYHQLAILVRSSFTERSSSLISVELAWSSVLSAYGNTSVLRQTLYVSFTRMLNRIGPRIDPCGTTWVINLSLDSSQPEDTYWYLSFKYLLNHLSSVPVSCQSLPWIKEGTYNSLSQQLESTALIRATVVDECQLNIVSWRNDFQ